MFYNDYNLTSFAKESLAAAEKAAVQFNQSYVGTEHILFGLLKVNSAAADVLSRHEISEQRVKELIEKLVAVHGDANKPSEKGRPEWTPKAVAAIGAAADEADRMGLGKVGTEHLLMGLFSQEDSVAMRLFRTMNTNDQKLLFDLCQSMGEEGVPYLVEMRERSSESAESGHLLEQFSKDLTAMAAQGKLDPVIGRDMELERMVRTLSRRTKNNPCLIGEPGVGKTAIVEKLASQIAAGTAPASMEGKRLLAIDLAGMVAGTKYRGEFEERIKGVVNEAIEDGNVLLFLDELHTIIGAGGSEGGLDAANILKPALSRGELRVIGATTVDEYKKHIEKDPALERRFQQIMVEEPSERETEDILFGLRHRYEGHHGLVITDEAVRAAASLSARYINDRFLPDKAIDLLDETASKVKMGGGTADKRLGSLLEELKSLGDERAAAIGANDFALVKEISEREKGLEKKISARRKGTRGVTEVTEADIAGVVADWTKIPVAKLSQSESLKLQHLEAELHKRLIGQDEAVKAVSMAVRRGRVGLKDPKRPIGSFLFLGPTGVGKTELAKALAEALFGRDESMIRVDMSEYMEQHSVSKLIGSPPGYVGFEEGGQFTDRVRRNPYSVILFDEIEKAHPDIFQVLLQILDDGHITDAQGRKVDFKNTIIIMTSNAGAMRIVEPKRLGFSSKTDSNADYEAMKSGVMEEVKRIFRPEFINRIDEILVFRQLGNDELNRILTNLINELGKRVGSAADIRLKVTPAVKKYVLAKGYDVKYGARPLRRAILSYIEDPLAMEILSGRVKAGETVKAVIKSGEIAFETDRPHDGNSTDKKDRSRPETVI